MNGSYREMPEHVADAILQSRLDCADDRMRTPAVGTFVVAVLNERHSGTRCPSNVISLWHHRHGQGRAPRYQVHDFSPPFVEVRS